MATSRGSAAAMGYSPSGSFGNGGMHQKGGVYGMVGSTGNDYMINRNMHTEVDSTAGTV